MIRTDYSSDCPILGIWKEILTDLPDITGRSLAINMDVSELGIAADGAENIKEIKKQYGNIFAASQLLNIYDIENYFYNISEYLHPSGILVLIEPVCFIPDGYLNVILNMMLPSVKRIYQVYEIVNAANPCFELFLLKRKDVKMSFGINSDKHIWLSEHIKGVPVETQKHIAVTNNGFELNIDFALFLWRKTV
jgi:hypothetical protein